MEKGQTESRSISTLYVYGLGHMGGTTARANGSRVNVYIF